MHNLKIARYILFRCHTKDYSSGKSLSDSSEELLLRGKEEQEYIAVFAEKKKKM